jgi:uridine kinase
VTRIAIDGVTAAGKTTFAAALAARTPGATRLTIDDFHRPPPQEYYPDSFDFEAFRAAVLAASRPLVADGVFLLHPDLRDLWDVTIFLRCDQAVAAERGIARDSSWLENARERYATRYVPGETRYLDEIRPETIAQLVVDTTDLAHPHVVIDSRP